MIKSSDAKKLKEYNMFIYNKGLVFISSVNDSINNGVNNSVNDGVNNGVNDGENNLKITTNEYFQFGEIYNIIHHPNIGIELIMHNKNRRVFYNNIESSNLYNIIQSAMNNWIKSNVN